MFAKTREKIVADVKEPVDKIVALLRVIAAGCFAIAVALLLTRDN